jgi:hypothetical protein
MRGLPHEQDLPSSLQGRPARLSGSAILGLSIGPAGPSLFAELPCEMRRAALPSGEAPLHSSVDAAASGQSVSTHAASHAPSRSIRTQSYEEPGQLCEFVKRPYELFERLGECAQPLYPFAGALYPFAGRRLSPEPSPRPACMLRSREDPPRSLLAWRRKRRANENSPNLTSCLRCSCRLQRSDR